MNADMVLPYLVDLLFIIPENGTILHQQEKF